MNETEAKYQKKKNFNQVEFGIIIFPYALSLLSSAHKFQYLIYTKYPTVLKKTQFNSEHLEFYKAHWMRQKLDIKKKFIQVESTKICFVTESLWSLKRSLLFYCMNS